MADQGATALKTLNLIVIKVNPHETELKIIYCLTFYKLGYIKKISQNKKGMCSACITLTRNTYFSNKGSGRN